MTQSYFVLVPRRENLPYHSLYYTIIQCYTTITTTIDSRRTSTQWIDNVLYYHKCRPQRQKEIVQYIITTAFWLRSYVDSCHACVSLYHMTIPYYVHPPTHNTDIQLGKQRNKDRSFKSVVLVYWLMMRWYTAQSKTIFFGGHSARLNVACPIKNNDSTPSPVCTRMVQRYLEEMRPKSCCASFHWSLMSSKLNAVNSKCTETKQSTTVTIFYKQKQSPA